MDATQIVDASALNFNNDPLDILREQNIFRKCELLTQHISVHTPKELQSYFSRIVDNLFEYNLCAINRSTAPGEFTSLVNLLAPAGPVFELAEKLSREVAMPRILLPLTKLPPAVVEQISRHDAASQFVLHRVSLDSSYVQLNPVEYFLFSFIGHVVGPRVAQIRIGVLTNWPEVIYFTLLDFYLAYFFDVDDVAGSPLRLPTSRTPLNSNVGGGSRFHPCGRRVGCGHRCLLKKDVGALMVSASGSPPNTASTAASPHHEHQPRLNTVSPVGYLSGGGGGIASLVSPSLSAKSVTLISTISELWFAHQSSSAPGACDNHQLQRAIRLLLKRMHWRGYFEPPLAMLPVIVHLRRRLYRSFKLLWLSAWPLDSSYRLPVENWLTFIQPWRYAGNSTPGSSLFAVSANNTPDINSSGGNTSNAVDLAQFKSFIDIHLLFYSQLLLLTLDRIRVLDLTLPSCALLISRICKVFTQAGLIDIVLERELVIHLLQQSVADLESPGFAVVDPQSVEWRSKAREIIRSLLHGQSRITERINYLEKMQREKSWWTKLWETLQGIPKSSLTAEAERTLEHVQSSIEKLSYMFRIDQSELDNLQLDDIDGSGEQEMLDLTSSATTVHHLRSRKRRRPVGEFDRRYLAIPEKLPPTGHEFVWMLNRLEQWSVSLNASWLGRHLRNVFSEEHGTHSNGNVQIAFGSRLLRQILLKLGLRSSLILPAASYIEIHKEHKLSGLSLAPRDHVEVWLPPRFFLRPLARHSLWQALTVSIVLVGLLGIPLFVLLLCILLMFSLILEKLCAAIFVRRDDEDFDF